MRQSVARGVRRRVIDYALTTTSVVERERAGAAVKIRELMARAQDARDMRAQHAAAYEDDAPALMRVNMSSANARAMIFSVMRHYVAIIDDVAGSRRFTMLASKMPLAFDALLILHAARR